MDEIKLIPYLTTARDNLYVVSCALWNWFITARQLHK